MDLKGYPFNSEGGTGERVVHLTASTIDRDVPSKNGFFRRGNFFTAGSRGRTHVFLSAWQFTGSGTRFRTRRVRHRGDDLRSTIYHLRFNDFRFFQRNTNATEKRARLSRVCAFVRTNERVFTPLFTFAKRNTS